jgi:hypothetical protein
MFRKMTVLQLLFPTLFVRFHAFDPDDADTKAGIAAAVDAAIEGLKKKNDELLGKLRKAQEKSGEGIDRAEFERMEAERDEARANLAEAQKQHKAAMKQATDASEALKAEQGFTSRLLIDNGLTTALTEAGVKNPAHLKAAAALLKSNGQLQIVTEGDNRVVKAGDKALGDFVKAWAGGDEGKAFVTAANNSGGGAHGSGGSQGGSHTGNMGGTPAERQAAIAAKYPELAQ